MYTTSKHLWLAALLINGIGTLAQTTTYFAPGIPTAQPIPGNYTGAYRPQVHFSPPQNFMNDPNGLHRGPDGTWHLYYQYNPLTPVAGNQHWGHATSEDLYHWTNQKIALWPYNETNYVSSRFSSIGTALWGERSADRAVDSVVGLLWRCGRGHE